MEEDVLARRKIEFCLFFLMRCLFAFCLNGVFFRFGEKSHGGEKLFE